MLDTAFSELYPHANAYDNAVKLPTLSILPIILIEMTFCDC